MDAVISGDSSRRQCERKKEGTITTQKFGQSHKSPIPEIREINSFEKKIVSHLGIIFCPVNWGDSLSADRGIPRPQNRGGDAEAPDGGYYCTESHLSVPTMPNS